MRVHHALTAVFCSTIFIAGCGGGPDDAPDLAPVSGTVMLDGKPAGGLTVEFHPNTDAGTTGPMSTGVTNDDGTFMLASSTGRGGAVIGDHIVLVKCPWRLTGREAPETADGFGSSEDGSEPEGAAEKGAPCTLDEKFESLEGTTLKASVPEAGVDDVLLQVTSGS